MSEDEDHYTLSPESVFVKAAKPKSLSTRIEEFYLGLMRLMILLILALTLIGGLTLAYRAYQSSDAEARPYLSTAQESPAEKFLAQVKRDTSSPGKGGDVKAGEGKSDVIEMQLTRQFALISEFLAPFPKVTISPLVFKERQRLQMEELVSAGVVSDPAAYARRQGDFFERVLKDKAVVDMLRQKFEQSPAYAEEFLIRLADFYPSVVREERMAKQSFEADERNRVAETKAQSISQLFAAAGMFAAFLVLCLILVLFKIERNLRTRGDVIQVVS